MIFRLRHKGFSLVEVMMSAGILAIGFVLIAGAFPVGVKLTAIATERTIGLAASSEAFAKIKLYGVLDSSDPAWSLPAGQHSVGFSFIANAGINLDFDPADPPPPDVMAAIKDQYNYPSTYLVDEKKYRWSALCRRIGSSNKVQVTVFVCRIAGPAVLYPEVDDGTLSGEITQYPAALRMKRDTTTLLVPADFTDNIIDIDVNPANLNLPVGLNVKDYVKYATEGSTLVDGKTGTLMYVTGLEVVMPEQVVESATITLLNPVDEGVLGDYFWVIPPSVKPAVGDDGPYLRVDGRYPCVGVYQQAEITF